VSGYDENIFARFRQSGFTPLFREGQSDYLSIANTKTNDLGEYRFFVMPAGSYYIATQPTADLLAADPTQRTTYYPGEPMPTRATLVTLSPGLDRRDVNMA